MKTKIVTIEPVEGSVLVKIHMATVIKRDELKNLLNVMSMNSEVDLELEIAGI